MRIGRFAVAGKTTALLFAGSTEQNGPYLPGGRHQIAIRLVIRAWRLTRPRSTASASRTRTVEAIRQARNQGRRPG